MDAAARWWAAVDDYRHTRFWRPFKLARLRRDAAAAMSEWCADNRRRYPDVFAYMDRFWPPMHV